MALELCERELLPLLKKLDVRRQHVFGEDFARKGDATVILSTEIGLDLVRCVWFQLELRNVPFDQQREILLYVVYRLPPALRLRARCDRLQLLSRGKGGATLWIDHCGSFNFGCLVQ